MIFTTDSPVARQPEQLAQSDRPVASCTRPDSCEALSTVGVSIGDASTLTDKIYRWASRGGGHVNAFRSSEELVSLIEKHVGLRLVATRLLCSSLSFLNRRTVRGRLPRRLILLGGGQEWTLLLYIWLSRRLDRLLGTRLRVYGWAFFFGTIPAPVDTRSWVNVCVRCGAATPAGTLRAKRVHGLLSIFTCPACGTHNPFSKDFG